MVAGPHCIIMPLRGPTCKIARFQAGLKFPSWTECGNNQLEDSSNCQEFGSKAEEVSYLPIKMGAGLSMLILSIGTLHFLKVSTFQNVS